MNGLEQFVSNNNVPAGMLYVERAGEMVAEAATPKGFDLFRYVSFVYENPDYELIPSYAYGLLTGMVVKHGKTKQVIANMLLKPYEDER